MKKLLGIATLFSFSILSAQPTIVENFAPDVGVQWTEFNTDETDVISLGAAGANQIWNYTGFTEEFESYVLDFLDPASLPAGFEGMFPDAQVALYEAEDSTANFFYSQADGFYLDGFGSISTSDPLLPSTIDFIPDYLFIPFDFTYLDTRTNVISSEIYIEDGIPLLLKSTIFTEIEGDGHGTITTPEGTYTDVLRLRVVGYHVDSTFADTNGDDIYEFINTDGPSDTTINYQHFQNAETLLIASVEMNSTETEILGFNYMVAGTVGVNEYESSSSLRVYPNPSTGAITVDFSEFRGPSVIEIYDVQGRLVHREQPQTPGDVYEIDLVGIGKGLYALVVISEGKRTSALLTIE